MNTKLNTSDHPFDGKKEKLMKDLKSVVVDADDLLKQVADSTAEEFAAARLKIEDRLDDAKNRLDDVRHTAVVRVRGAADATHEYVIENPWKILGVGAAVGVLVAYLFSRR